MKNDRVSLRETPKIFHFAIYILHYYMKLHELKTIKSRRSRRIGRGGKRGTTAGRGTKGQRSRAGHRIRPAERDLIMRLPKRRGFRNKPKSDAAVIFNLGELSEKLKTHAEKGSVEISHGLLRSAKMIGKNYKGEIKILAEGEIAFPITVKGIKVSKAAREKIEKSGGKSK
jgi:large subunit ribosomal protein L15